MSKVFKINHIISTVFLALLLPALSAQAISEPSYTETARPADAFVDSIGVNVHLGFIDTTYSNYTDIVRARLVESGVRHIRDICPTINQTEFQDRLIDLANSGIRSLLVCTPRIQSISNLSNVLHKLSNSVEMVEGPNETDQSGLIYKNRKYPFSTRLFQDELFAMTKTDPALRHLSVLMASICNPDQAHFLGTLKSADMANSHCYTGGTPPGFRWNWYMVQCQTNFQGPVIISETGYHTAVKQLDKLWIRGVSETAAGKYTTRLFAEHFLRGVSRTYIYELLDERQKINFSEANFGLVRANGDSKPAFYGIKNMILILADSGPAFDTTSLEYSVNSDDQPVRHLLLQKRNGHFFLLLWINAESYSLKDRRDIAFDPRPTRLVFSKPIMHAKAFLPLAGPNPVADFDGGTEVMLRIPDQVVILEIQR